VQNRSKGINAMSEKPSTEDTRKIHAEINQIVNQRYLLATFSITMFGAMLALFFPKNLPNPNEAVGSIVIGGCILLIFLLLLVYIISHLLLGKLRVLSSYLRATDSSVWEIHWEKYNRKFPEKWGYTRAITLVFMMLGLTAFGMPFFIAITHDLYVPRSVISAALWIVFIVYEVTLYLLGFKYYHKIGSDSYELWKKIL
jgi:hypothetical protein